MRVTSPAFAPGARIPKKYTKDGKDLSPPLVFHDVPSDAKQLALICDDPDAPRPTPWVHWVLYGLAGAVRDLAENESAGGKEGKNDYGDDGWGGPQPPKGHGVHHYHFKLFALKEAIDLPGGATKEQLLAAMEGKILARAELIGTYER